MNRNPSIEKRANFGFIRYANCWEDSDVLLKAIGVKEGGRYLSIASAGDNTLALLIGRPSMVVAADLSTTQLACLELRMAAFAELSHEDLLRFLGIWPCRGRWELFEKISGRLSAQVREHWDRNKSIIESGISFAGKFENYFRLFRSYVVPLIHSRRNVETLLQPKSRAERELFYDRVWNNARWKLLFRIFFSRTLMGRLGRDKEFFRYVEGDVAARILSRTKYALTELETSNNPYLNYILRGNYGEALPTYLRRENFEVIRRNLSAVRVFHGSVSDAIHAHSSIKFDGFNLSDIFEYMDDAAYEENLRCLIGASNSGARLVYWNMLVDRGYAPSYQEKLRPRPDLAEQLFMEDKAFFYKRLVVEEVIS